MQIARVKGTVVSTNKSEKMYGMKLMVVRPIDLDTFEEKGAPIVSVDAVGAGVGEIVMIVGGSSSRQTDITDAKPVDNSIIAIIDSIDIGGTRIFDKSVKPDEGRAGTEKKEPVKKDAQTAEQLAEELLKEETTGLEPKKQD